MVDRWFYVQVGAIRAELCLGEMRRCCYELRNGSFRSKVWKACVLGVNGVRPPVLGVVGDRRPRISQPFSRPFSLPALESSSSSSSLMSLAGLGNMDQMARPRNTRTTALFLIVNTMRPQGQGAFDRGLGRVNLHHINSGSKGALGHLAILLSAVLGNDGAVLTQIPGDIARVALV